MNSLRWTLGITTVLVTVGFVALVVFADGFRRSLGASENAPWKIVVPLVVMTALLVSIAFPSQRWVMHGTALLMVAVSGACVYVLRESVFVGVSGLIYCALWAAYYWQAVWVRLEASPS